MIICNAPETVGPWVASRTGGTWSPGRGSCIGLVDEENKLVAGVLCEDFNGANVLMHVAAEPGGIVRQPEFVEFVFGYVFGQLGCKRVTGVIASTNERALKLAAWLGFKEEARLAGAHPEGDLVILAMHSVDCKWLRRSKHAKVL